MGDIEAESGPSGVQDEQLDRHGFFLQSKDINVTHTTLTPREVAKQRVRESKWRRMLSDWDAWAGRNKTKERCRKGVPDSLRGQTWRCLSGALALQAQNPGLFDSLCATADAIVDGPLVPFFDVVDKDLHRTYPHHAYFHAAEGRVSDG